MKQESMWCFQVVLLLCSIYITGVCSGFSLIFTRMENCDPTVDYTNKFYTTFRTVDGKQYVDGNATLRAAIDDDMKCTVTIEWLVGKNYMRIMDLEERHSCSAMHKFIGEFAYDLERHAQMVPGLCPIPTGRYHIHNYLPNFNKVTVQSFPFGHLRQTIIGRDKNNKLLGCIVAEFENEAV